MAVQTQASAEQARLEFGKFLVAQRERRGLSRSDLVRVTKLPSLLVGAIEDGETEKWPERVFVVNALKSYAGAVGLSVDETLSRFDGLPDAPKDSSFDPKALELQRREHAISAVLVTVALVLTVALGGWLQTVWLFAQRAAWSAR
ncbi:MAG: transcriptional regulator [Archangiaceae bacterium]|nr:transcriptional regulator [Archangiaceae bacterium]